MRQKGGAALEEELLSKKELLELTGISYGQLYRWKRKGLIPEEWFIRKATYTGQETFFPRQMILDRVGKIIDMKDDMSLDELAELFSPLPADIEMTADQLFSRNIVSQVAWNLFVSSSESEGPVSFPDILAMYAADALLRSGSINLDEARALIETLLECNADEANLDTLLSEGEVVIVRKMGTSIVMIARPPGAVTLERGAAIAAKLPMPECAEQLKTILIHGGEFG